MKTLHKLRVIKGWKEFSIGPSSPGNQYNGLIEKAMIWKLKEQKKFLRESTWTFPVIVDSKYYRVTIQVEDLDDAKVGVVRTL